MSIAGERDRLIGIAIVDSEDDDAGAPVAAYGEFVEYWAHKEEARAEADYGDGLRTPVAQVSFVIEFDSNLFLPLAVKYDGTIFDVLALEEIGYREELRLRCRAARRTGAV
jgi:hypothetical protein